MFEKEHVINFGGILREISRPLIMGVINATPDSFYPGSRVSGEVETTAKLQQMLEEGADIIDCGAYSSRPGADHITIKEEMARLDPLLRLARNHSPQVIISLDTFRSEVVKWAVQEHGINMVNDISAGFLDEKMPQVVAGLNVPYVMMHMKGTPGNMQDNPHYDNLMREITGYFAERIVLFRGAGVRDIIVDPGFGFGKTIAHNYELLQNLEQLHITNCPIMVGVSRKSMIYKLLGISPEESLPGTIALNMVALLKGASILRVHDVKEAAQIIGIFQKLSEFHPL